jgi:hypothetical protein
MKSVYFHAFHDLSIKNINYWLHPDNTEWIPPGQWHGNRALWDTSRLVAPIKRAVERTYYVTQGDDLEEMRRKLLEEDVNLPPIGFG